MTSEEIADGYTTQENSISCQLVHLVQCLPKPVRNLWLKQHAWLFPGFSQTARAELAKLDNKENDELTADETVDFVFVQLSSALNLESFEPCEGTETWDGDVIATLWKILRNAGVVDDNNAVATHARISELEAELARAREALEPFAKAADIKLCGEFEDRERFGRTDVSHYLTFGDLRRARTALKGQTHD